MRNQTIKRNNMQRLVFIALFCALAYVFTFAFHIDVMFLTFDFKNTILVLCALIFGPTAGVIASLLVCLLELLTFSDTGIWGFVMNFASAAVYVFVAGIIYKYRKTLFGAVLSLSCASLAMFIAMILLNIVVTPIYQGAPLEAVLELMVPLLMPFNAIKAVLCSATALLIYKPVRTAFRSAGINFSNDSSTPAPAYKLNKKTVIVSICAAVVIIICVILYFTVFKGQFVLLETAK